MTGNPAGKEPAGTALLDTRLMWFAVLQVVAANGLDTASGGPISIVAGKVEDVQDIGHEKVGDAYLYTIPLYGVFSCTRSLMPVVCGYAILFIVAL